MFIINKELIDKNISYSSKNTIPIKNDPLFTDQLLLHEWYELFFVKAGDVSWFIDNEVYPAPPYSLVIFNNKELHKLQIKPEIRFERTKFMFNPELVRQFKIPGYDLLSCFEDRTIGSGNILRLTQVEGMELMDLFGKFGESASSDRPVASLEAGIAFLQILLFANRVFNQERDEDAELVMPEKTLLLMKYIDDHLSEDLSLETLSAALGISRYHMCRMFKESTGSTLHNYILYKRISESKGLLDDGFGIPEATARSGFGSVSRFVAAFKKVVGISPAMYRKLEGSIG